MNNLYEKMTDEEKSEFRTKWIMEFGCVERTVYNRIGDASKTKRFELIRIVEMWLETVKHQKISYHD